MLTNKYIKRLFRTYSQAEIDRGSILKAIDKATTMISENLGIKQEDLDDAARALEVAARASNTNLNRMSDKQLMLLVLTTLWRFVPPEYRTHNIEEHDVAAQALAVELTDDAFMPSAYRNSYNSKNRAFASINTSSRISKSVLLGALYIASSLLGEVKAAELVHNMAANPENTIKIVQQVIKRDIAPEDSILRYRKSITPDNPYMEQIMPALNMIKKYAGPHIDKIYANFVASDALTLLPAQDILDPSTRIALRLYKSAKIMYNELLKKKRMSFDELLSKERTKLAAQHIVFASIAYNVLGQLDYEVHRLSPEQIGKLRQELRAGNYEVELRDQSSFDMVIKKRIDNIYLEFELIPAQIEMMGVDYVESDLKQSEYSNQLLHNFRTYKCAIAPVKGTTLYDIYVVLPVTYVGASINPAHEVVFKIRCSLNVKVHSPAQGSSVSSVAQHANDVSRLRSKSARLFNRKKKYDWM